MSQPTESRAPRFVAYVYPGWHQSSYRPQINEWQLLDTFRPYFEGHLPPPLPAEGPYDDGDPATASRQVEIAHGAGIQAFTYFTYYGSSGFVMETPMDHAFGAAANVPGSFSIGGTLCIRLPHDRFPVPARDDLEVPEPTGSAETLRENFPLELLTLRDLTELLSPSILEQTVILRNSRARLTSVEAAILAADAHVETPERDCYGDTPRQGSFGVTENRPAMPPATELTLAKLATVLERLTEIALASRHGRPAISDVARLIREMGVAALSLNAVANLVEAVATVHDRDVLTAFSLKQLEELLTRVD